MIEIAVFCIGTAVAITAVAIKWKWSDDRFM